MKKKGLRILSVVLAFSLLLSMFALTACGDSLDEVEKDICGTWRTSGAALLDGAQVYEFSNDGSFSIDGSKSGTFKHDGDGTSNGIFRYSIIILSYNSGETKKLYYYKSDDHHTMKVSASASGADFLYRNVE